MSFMTWKWELLNWSVSGSAHVRRRLCGKREIQAPSCHNSGVVEMPCTTQQLAVVKGNGACSRGASSGVGESLGPIQQKQHQAGQQVLSTTWSPSTERP